MIVCIMTSARDDTTVEDLFDHLDELGVNVREMRRAYELGKLQPGILRDSLAQLLEAHIFQRYHKDSMSGFSLR
jgi:hypothetical protein